MLKCKNLALVAIAFLCFSYFCNSCIAVERSDVEEVLAKAENDLAYAYVTVADAQQSGANVSELLPKLRLASNLLAEANNSFRTENYEKAFLLASNCSDVLRGVTVEASVLKREAQEAYRERLWFTTGISSVGLVLLFVLGLFGWRFLKKRYVEKVLEMKPEVEVLT